MEEVPKQILGGDAEKMTSQNALQSTISQLRGVMETHKKHPLTKPKGFSTVSADTVTIESTFVTQPRGIPNRSFCKMGVPFALSLGSTESYTKDSNQKKKAECYPSEERDCFLEETELTS